MMRRDFDSYQSWMKHPGSHELPKWTPVFPGTSRKPRNVTSHPAQGVTFHPLERGQFSNGVDSGDSTAFLEACRPADLSAIIHRTRRVRTSVCASAHSKSTQDFWSTVCLWLPACSVRTSPTGPHQLRRQHPDDQARGAAITVFSSQLPHEQ